MGAVFFAPESTAAHGKVRTAKRPSEKSTPPGAHAGEPVHAPKRKRERPT
jgi:hypothetical protein